MKHTIAIRHGHTTRTHHLDKPKRVCIPLTDAVRNDYDSCEYELREMLSRKWKVCIDCFTDKKNLDKIYGVASRRIIYYTCGIGRCPAWGKPKRTKVMLHNSPIC